MNGVEVKRGSRSARAPLALVVVGLIWAALLASAATASAAGSISGTVTAAADEAPVAGVEVCAVEELESGEREWVKCTGSDAAGEYTLAELAAGEYIVEFWAWELGYLPQCWDEKPCGEGPDPVAVADEPVTGIDAKLTRLGTIEGTVSDAKTGAGIAEAEVCAYEELEPGEWEWAGCAYGDAGGHYALSRLSGEYVIEFWAPGHVPQLFNGKSNLAEADRVSVAVEETVSGIDGRLEPVSLVPAGVVTPPPPPAPPIRPKRKRCRKGLHRKKVRGHLRCVRRHHRKRHHRRRG